jgi:hypothetical protein
VPLEQVLDAKACMLFYAHPGEGWSGASVLASAGDSAGDSGSPPPEDREKAEGTHVETMHPGALVVLVTSASKSQQAILSPGADATTDMQLLHVQVHCVPWWRNG